MAERTGATLRIVLIALMVANALFFAYAVLAPEDRARASARIEELQINPGRIRIVGSATRGPARQMASAKGDEVYRACLEWGPFDLTDARRAESALARLALTPPPLQRAANSPAGTRRYSQFVREPDAATVARIAELRRAFPGSDIKAGPCPAG